MKFQMAVFLFLIISLTMCSYSNNDFITINDLENAEEYLTLNNDSVYLDVFLWRNITDTCQLTTQDSLMHGNIDIMGMDDEHIIPQLLWIFNNNGLWEYDIADFNEDSIGINIYIDEGPKWGPGIMVDAVIRFEYQSRVYLLKSNDNLIYIYPEQ